MSIHSVILQIENVQNSIYSLNHHIVKNKEALERLEKVLSEVVIYQGDYHQNSQLWMSPGLTSKTWNGQLATDFRTFRDKEVKTSYESISDKQLSRTITSIKDEIATLRQEIGVLQDKIINQETRLSNLIQKKREELSKQDE